MQHRYVALIIFACTFATLSPIWALGNTISPIVLSEIQWGGSAHSTADEWIELTNTSSEVVDISSWKITGIVSQEDFLLPENTVLEGYATYLIANYAPGDEKTVLTTQAQLVDTRLSIPNTSTAITLIDSTGRIIDTYSEIAVGTTDPHASAERDLLTGMWVTATTAYNIASQETFGSPGYVVHPLFEEILPEEEETLPDETLPLSEELPPEEVVVEEDISPPEEIIEEQREEVRDVPTEDEVVEVDVAPEVATLILPLEQEVITTSVSEEEIVNISTPTISVTYDYSTLHVNEFISDPSEGAEWIELWNAGIHNLPLDGINIADSSGKITALTGEIAAQEYLLVENPKGKLNNTGDRIILTLPDGQIAFTLIYGTETFSFSKKGTSTGACDDGWHTNLTPSPQAKNLCSLIPQTQLSYATEIPTTPSLEFSSSTSGASSTTQGNVQKSEDDSTIDTPITEITASVVLDTDDEDEDVLPTKTKNTSSPTSPTKQKTLSKNTLISVEIEDLAAVPSGQRVTVTGSIIAEPGIFGKRIAYLDGVQLYFHKATWPSLPAGTHVSLVGTWESDEDTRRIKIANTEDITMLGEKEIEALSFDEVTPESSPDILVSAFGSLIKKEGDVMIFSSMTGKDFRVIDLAKTGAFHGVRSGDTLTITGLLFPHDGNWAIAPRSTDDAVPWQQEHSLIPSPDTHTETTLITPTTNTLSPKTPPPIIGGGILAGSVSALGYWFFRTKKLSFLFS